MKWKDEVTNYFRGKVSKLHDDVKIVENELDRQQQYSRRNCLLLYEIGKINFENTVKLVLNTLNTGLNLDLTINDRDKSFQIWKVYVIEVNSKSITVTVKIVCSMVSKNVFEIKRYQKLNTFEWLS